MRIFVQDFSGHPFQVQLSRELARRGHVVAHTWCPDYASGQGSLVPRLDDPPTLNLDPIRLGARFDKYRYGRRLRQELRYGRLLVDRVQGFAPDLVLSCNEPLFAKLVLGWSCRKDRRRWIFWLQDLYSVAMRRELASRGGALGDRLGAGFERVERWLLSSASGVVSITPAFQEWMREHGLAPAVNEVIPNWAPLDEVEYFPRRQSWFDQHLAIGDAPVALYSGTLGRKHNTDLLVRVADAISPIGAHLVVISEGPAAEALRAQAKGMGNLHVLPFQPWSEFAAVLGSSSVLLAILEPEAGAFSVPSKVVTYLCAGRAIAGSIPTCNLAARIVQGAGAGTVVPADDPDGFAQAVVELVSDPERAAAMGRRAREHAEQAFDIEAIADRFEEVFRRAMAQELDRDGIV